MSMIKIRLEITTRLLLRSHRSAPEEKGPSVWKSPVSLTLAGRLRHMALKVNLSGLKQLPN